METELDRMKYALEQSIDKLGVDSFLELVGTICHEKAEHVASNWQDKGLARQWENIGHAIEAIAQRYAYGQI